MGIDDKLRSKNGNVVRYFLTDHLGSTEALTDANGAITSSTSYDSFGNAASNIATSYQYTGREYDADTGLYYYRNRWYDPETGRFISEDPIGFAGGDINLYGYVWNSPYNFIDPYGENSLLTSLVSRSISVGTSATMLVSYVNAPGPGDPVYNPGGNPSLADTIGNAVGLVATPVVGKVIGKACTFALKGIGRGAGAVGRAVGRGIDKASKSAKRLKAPAPKGLKGLQSQFDELADAYLLPQFRKLDPNLTAGFTGSFRTGIVGNPNKARFGQPIDLNDFDVDFFIKSDTLFKKFGGNLRANPEFRKILANTPGFEGLRPNKKGFSIKFLPSSN